MGEEIKNKVSYKDGKVLISLEGFELVSVDVEACIDLAVKKTPTKIDDGVWASAKSIVKNMNYEKEF